MLLACIGLHGLLAYNVASRTGEVGIRMALGAQQGDIARPILHEALLLAAAGLVVGVPAALVPAQLIKTQLYGVLPGDPLSPIIGIVLLLAVALLAAWLPARRATCVDALVTLCSEQAVGNNLQALCGMKACPPLTGAINFVRAKKRPT